MNRFKNLSAASRRQFLAATGLGAGSLFLPSLAGKQARADGGDAPLRLVVWYSLHGCVYDQWRMRPGNRPENEDWEVDLGGLSRDEFSTSLEPLYDVRDQLMILDGLSLVGPRVDIPYDGHPLGQIHSLTGAPVRPIAGFVAGATQPSVDQIIAEEISRDDLFRSLEWSPGNDPGTASPIWSMGTDRLPIETDPNVAFDRLFPGSDPNSGQDAAAVWERQSSVLDLVASRYDALAPNLSGEDRRKLELHRDLVRDVERRLGSLRNLSCDIPNAPDGQWYDQSWEEAYDDKYQAYIGLIAAALSCDLTRVVSIQMTDLANERFGAPPGDVHLDFAHLIHSDQASHDYMTEYVRVHAEQFRDLVALLDSVPEGDGTMLDNTIVMWCSEIGDGAHRFAPWPVVLAGGRCAGFNPGRYIHYGPRIPGVDGEFGGDAVDGESHNKLLVSLAQAFGVERDSIGLAEARLGGTSYSLSGPLDFLTS